MSAIDTLIGKGVFDPKGKPISIFGSRHPDSGVTKLPTTGIIPRTEAGHGQVANIEQGLLTVLLNHGPFIDALLRRRDAIGAINTGSVSLGHAEGEHGIKLEETAGARRRIYFGSHTSMVSLMVRDEIDPRVRDADLRDEPHRVIGRSTDLLVIDTYGEDTVQREIELDASRARPNYSLVFPGIGYSEEYRVDGRKTYDNSPYMEPLSEAERRVLPLHHRTPAEGHYGAAWGVLGLMADLMHPVEEAGGIHLVRLTQRIGGMVGSGMTIPRAVEQVVGQYSEIDPHQLRERLLRVTSVGNSDVDTDPEKACRQILEREVTLRNPALLRAHGLMYIGNLTAVSP